jgi:anti-sigma factor RsiW
MSTMNNQSQTPNDPRHLLADYLGDELSPEQRRSFEHDLADDADLAAEVESLRGALVAMRALDAGDAPDSSASPAPLAAIRPASRRGHLVRVAALLALAFIGGYLVKGMEPAPGVTRGPGAARTSEGQANDGVPAADRGTSFVKHYLDGNDRRGFGRTLVAYARATKDDKKN